MSKITKRLLSLLVVIAMVVAMAPATGLPAVEVKAAEQTTSAELVLDADGKGWCPACQDTVQWTAYDGTKQYTDIADSQHLYLAADTSYTVGSANMITLTTGGKVCFHLNGHTLTVLRSAGARIWVNSGCTGLNLFGEGGGIVNNNYNTIQHNGGYVNVYGGTYTDTTENNKFATTSSSQGKMTLQNADVGVVELNGASAKLVLQGTTVVDNIHRNNGAVQLASDWSGTATTDIPVENLNKISYTGAAPSGIVTLATGEKLAYANGGVVVSEEDVCSACNESVAWEVFDGTKQYASIATHKHFYLAEDVTYDGSAISANMIQLGAGGSVCFDLNGHTLNVIDARIWLTSSAAEEAELNIFANGGAVNYTKRAFIQQNKGAVNIVGGTYTPSETESFVDTATRYFLIEDATVNGNLTSQSGATKFVLKGAANVGKINIDAGGKVELKSDWTGAATLDMDASELTDGKVPADKLFCTGGVPTGTVTLATGEALVYDDGAYGLPFEKECPVCGEVEWTKFDGTQQFAGITEHKHFYLASDVTYDGSAISANMISLGAGGSVCFDLNGHTLNVIDARIWLTGSAGEDAVLNIFANGGSVNYSKRAFIQQNVGAVSIIGGTYTPSETEAFVSTATRYFLIDGATINGNLTSQSGATKFVLKGAANVGTINLDLGGKVELKSDWTGSAVLDLEASELSAEKVFYTGEAPTGTVTLTTGETLAYKNGTVYVPYTGECPVCGEVEWELFDGTEQFTGIDTHRHFYLAEDTHYTVDSVNMITLTTGGAVCFNLNGHTLTVDRAAGARIWVNTGSVGLNIFGEGGGIVNNGYNTIQHNAGYVNVYGGTYTDTTEANKFATTSAAGGMMLQNVDAGVIVYEGLAANVELKGSTVVDSIKQTVYEADGETVRGYGALKLASDWTGTATVEIPVENLSKISYTGEAPTGTVTLTTGETLAYKNGAVYVPYTEECPVCGEVEWTLFDGTEQFAGITEHKHFYLASDVTYDGAAISANMISLGAGGSVCFDLNGHTLNVIDARIWLTGSAGEDAVVNIFANGGAVNYTKRAFIQQNVGAVSIIGGTYTPSETESFVSTATRYFLIDGATINGNLTSQSAATKFVLKGAANVGTINLDLGGKVELKSDWTGTATLDLDVSELSAEKVFYTGAAPTGTVTLATGETLVCAGGTVMVPNTNLCPVCGEVEWTLFDGTQQFAGITEHKHFYLASDVTYDGSAISANMIQLGAGGSVCFDLNGHTLNVIDARIWLTSSAAEEAELNIFANGGAVNYTKRAFIQQNKGAVSIIGGTYTPSETESFVDTATRYFLIDGATINGNLTSQSAATKFVLKGAANVGTINLAAGGKVELKSDWTGTATLDLDAAELSADKVFYTGAAPTGTVTLATGETLVCAGGTVMIPNTDLCPVCGEVEWTLFDGTQQFAGITEHKHFYLASDVTYDGSAISANMISLGAGGSVCFDLNGHTLNVIDARIWLTSSAAEEAVVNIFANGGAVNYTKRAFIQQNKGAVSIIGGTYTPSETESFVSTATRYFLIDGATINGNLTSQSGATKFVLKGAANVGTINLDLGGKVELKSDWTGTATLDLDAAELSADKVFYTGAAPTGTVKLATGEVLECKNGTVRIPLPAFEEECPVCGEVEWEVFDGTQQFTGINTHRHFYLAEDTTYTFGSVNMISVGAGGSVCFNLNGHKLTIGNAEGSARFWMTGSATDGVLNIFANGGEIDYANRAIIQAAGGTTNIYGGTYGSSTGCETFADVTEGVLNIDGATVNGNIVNASWKGVIKLTGTTTVDTVKLDYLSSTGNTLYGKLELCDGWSGTATVDLDNTYLVDGKLDTAKVSYSGVTPTGKLYLSTGEELVCQSGAVRLPLQTRTAVCSACGVEKVWTEYDGTRMLGITGEQHLYLADDLTITSGASMMTVLGNANVCFDLNGHKLTTQGYIELNDGETSTTKWEEDTNTSSGETEEVGVFNLIANGGSVDYTGYGTFIKHVEATLNIIGGTYTPTQSNQSFFAVSRKLILEDATINGDITLDSVRSMLTLKGNTNINGEVIVLDDQRVHREPFMVCVDSSFTGNAVLNVPAVCMVNDNGADLLLPTIENGALQTARYVANGDFTGNVTLTNGAKLFNNDGTLVLGTAKVAGETITWYKTTAEAVAAYTEADFAAGNYIKTYCDAEIALTGANYYIDANGNDLTITGTGKLYAMDSDNAEDFEGFGSWTVAEGIEIVRDFTIGGNRYIVITENGVTSAHALVITLSGLTINTTDAGLYYDAQYKCDDTLAAKISTYGIIASLKDMPGAKLGSGDERTELHNFAPDWNHEVLSDSSTVYGIFKDTRSAAQNATFGKMDIYANPYIELDVDGDGAADVIVGDTENVGKKAGNAWSLYDALKHINDNWTAFAGDRIAVRDFYNAWAAKGMSEYAADLGNIIAAEGSKVETPLKSTDIEAVNAAGMTEDERRAEVLDFMDKTMSFAWTPNVETNHYNDKGDGDYFVRTYEVGKVYGGTPYVTNTQGNLYTMMEYYDETTGILDLSGGMDTIKMFSNQCSGSVYWAWQRVCASAKFESTATMVASNGCLPVGPYTYDTTISSFYEMNETGANGNPTATNVIINANGVQTMYESYALVKPADGLVTFIDGNNHARMVSGTPNVVRNGDGTINGNASTLTYIDQSGVMEQTKEQGNGTVINLIGDHNVTKSFADLIVEGYIPFTFAELNGGDVAQSSTSISAQANATVAQLAAATVSSNYGISDITYVVKDAQGNEVYRELFVTYTTVGLHNYSISLGAKKMIDTDALAFFADGNHTVEISVRIGTGEKPVVYTGTLAG